MKAIDKLIINSPYEEPKEYWKYIRDTREFVRIGGERRPAGYVIATPGAKAYDDPGIFVEIKLVNAIRPRVKAWRERGYPGVTGITKRLLEHWQDPEERKDRRFFFCQLEAIETLIWLTEAPEAEKTGVEIPGDGGAFVRWCNKMATGSGKTIVMAMLIAWQVLNKIANNQDARFSKNVLVVAPGLTVRSRLSVLDPFDDKNYYEEFNIVPPGLLETLRQTRPKIINWHTLAWDSEEKLKKKKSVDKRGPKSDEAYVREVLGGDMAKVSSFIVINDEAHHAWRIPAESKVKGIKKEDIEESTVWVGGLDRIHRARKILRCFDFSATPFAPSGKKASEEALYTWIVSDFGLNDAIESGLVKTPRVVVRDDGLVDANLRPRLYHIYADDTVRDDLNRPAEKTVPLPDLIRNAYLLLAKDWKATKDEWEKARYKVPPVMITVANTTNTSARIKYSFEHDAFYLSDAGLGDLCEQERTLQIDSAVLQKAEANTGGANDVILDENGEDEENPREKKLTKEQQGKLLRVMVDTVGKIGQPGERIQNVISVGMLSEGWDAKTVTHIMGLRAFSSQLLCEQVVGRGLRRWSYDVGANNLFEPEYVNIFGVPFTFLPHEGGTDGPPPPPPPPKTRIEPVKEKGLHEILFPNVLRIDHVYKPKLTLDMEKVKVLELDPYDSVTQAELAGIIAGKPIPAALTDIDLKEIANRLRLQTIVFRIASAIYNSEKRPDWKGSKEVFLIQLIRIIERLMASDKIHIKNTLWNQDETKRRILIMLSMNKVIQHIWNEIRAENTAEWTPVFDREHPIRSTGDMSTWWTSRPCEDFSKSHINQTVVDKDWEYLEARTLNDNDHVVSFVKNDHLGFAVFYNYQGVVRRYFPDFIIKLANGSYLVLETKGRDNDEGKTKREFLKDWCRAVNQHGGFGKWQWAVSFDPNDLEAIIKRANKE
jgi:type III restriction enzyme